MWDGFAGVERAADEAHAELIVIGRGRESEVARPETESTGRDVVDHAGVEVLTAEP